MSGKKSLLVDKSKMPLAMESHSWHLRHSSEVDLLPEHRFISILSTTESGVC